MALSDKDRKTLWAKSGNRCSFPECNVPLAADNNMNRVMGQEAHIKGEASGAARYDPCQSALERESYENRILLCPTHHSMIDADQQAWTVDKLRQMKAKHEEQVAQNWQYPELLDDLKKVAEKYLVQPDTSVSSSATTQVDGSSRISVVRVDASQESGCNTQLSLKAGQRVLFFARGLISYNARHNFTTPEGIITNEYGIPFQFKDETGLNGMAVWPHPDAYKTEGNNLGRIGSLIGWIDSYTESGAFFIGSKREILIPGTGILYLAVNDVSGTYGDNDGEFRVDIRQLDDVP